MARRIPGACRDVLVYLAWPLFSEAERRFNLELTYRLEAIGFEVFLPQRDGVERDRPPYDTMRGATLFSTSTGAGYSTQTCSCSTGAFPTRERAWSLA